MFYRSDAIEVLLIPIPAISFISRAQRFFAKNKNKTVNLNFSFIHSKLTMCSFSMHVSFYSLKETESTHLARPFNQVRVQACAVNYYISARDFILYLFEKKNCFVNRSIITTLWILLRKK